MITVQFFKVAHVDVCAECGLPITFVRQYVPYTDVDTGETVQLPKHPTLEACAEENALLERLQDYPGPAVGAPPLQDVDLRLAWMNQQHMHANAAREQVQVQEQA